MKLITIMVPATTGEMEVRGYLPFEGCEFMAHKTRSLADFGDDIWVISHVRSGLRVPMTRRDTRRESLALAEQLHKQCPSAASVTMGERPKSGEVRVKGAGKHAALVAEIKQVLGFGIAA